MNERELLDKLFDELYPIMRSITGPGIEESMGIFARYMPLEITKVKTGTKVFDWTVPLEWHFREAKIIDPEGLEICNANVNNLHVVNYSESINKEVTLSELNLHLHSIPELPEAIPYVISYYKKTWGFCIPHSQRLKLKEGKYKVIIDADFVEGGVPFAQCKIKGESEKEILLTSYLCHPSLANNELSGPLVLLCLYMRILKWEKRRYTYRFLFNPETIGSLCFLYKHAEEIKDKIVSGLILTCLGGTSKNMRYKCSKKGDALIDKVSEYANNKALLPIDLVPFCPLSGSDERQYCSPGFNFPMGQISKTTYGSYKEYHTSLDNKEFMGIDNLLDSINVIEKLLKYVDVCGNPINLAPFGEPQLGKRGLYPNINSSETRNHSGDESMDGRIQLNRILLMLSMSDGSNSLIDIANKANCTIDEIIPTLLKLEENCLIDYNVNKLKI